MKGPRNRASTKLTSEQQAFVIERLARWDTPNEAAKALFAEFGVRITRQAAERYDPTTVAGGNLAQRWVDHFNQTRARHLDDLKNIPESNKHVRIAQLSAMTREARNVGNLVLAASLLEQIAKEMGNVYTNRRELSGRDGKPMEFKFGHLTDAELDNRIDAMLDEINKILNGHGDADDGPTLN